LLPLRFQHNLASSAEKRYTRRGGGKQGLESLKLTSFRLKDKIHLLDMLDVGLIGEEWCDRLPADLAARLKELAASPDREP
jgi:hypothetical protein